jgi:hypothetical protein
MFEAPLRHQAYRRGLQLSAFSSSQRSIAHPPQELTRPDWTGEQVLVETFIPGKELTCAVMANARWT